MLAFLLAQGKEPIVLDQPEDDLDNHLIYELVVRQIHENKLHRQLICRVMEGGREAFARRYERIGMGG